MSLETPLSNREWVERLQIERRGESGFDWLFPWFDEQEFLWRALHTKKKVLAIKPRRVGFTTLATAFFFEKSYRSPKGRRVLQYAHDPDSIDALRKMVEGFHDNLPPELQCGTKTRNDETTAFRNGTRFERRLAGAAGKVRGKGFHDLHMTEAAFYPQRARHGAAGDRETWASANAAIDADDATILVESTGHGPQGLFHELYRQAKSGDPEWELVFVPWTKCLRYRKKPPARFRESLDDAEQKLLDSKVCTLEQLAWRRSKMTTDRMTLLEFRREYPLNDMEPFLVDQAGWFDLEPLARALEDALAFRTEDNSRPWTIYHPPERGRSYFQGVDTSGGTGGDYAVGSMWRDDLLQVAVWRSNRMSPSEQAKMTTDASNLYNRAVTLVEANNHGKDVIERAAKLGCPLWKDSDGNYFWSKGGRAGESKRSIYVDARDIVRQEGLAQFTHPETVRELMVIVEKDNGRIEAAGDGHDDCADAAVLGWRCARGHINHEAAYNPEREKMRALAMARRPAAYGAGIR